MNGDSSEVVETVLPAPTARVDSIVRSTAPGAPETFWKQILDYLAPRLSESVELTNNDGWIVARGARTAVDEAHQRLAGLMENETTLRGVVERARARGLAFG